MRVPTILAAACLLLVSCQQEEGCTDPNAVNYNPDAVEDDSSCDYPPEIDGFTYDVVTIGEQVWFAENLRTTTYANGDVIPAGLSDGDWSSTTSGATAVYGEDSSYCSHNSPDIDACDELQSLAEYGRLYNWYAVDDARGLCPVGWHVPTDEEWTDLQIYISSQGFSATKGTALKASYGWVADGTYGWVGDGNGTDDFGFSALPGGNRDCIFIGAFHTAGAYGNWWSSSPDGGDAWHRAMSFNNPDVVRGSANPHYGYSVRCLKD